MQPPDGGAFDLSGEFLDVQRPRRLSFTFRGRTPILDDCETVVALSLEPIRGMTKVSLSQGEFTTAARLELHRSGWADSFEKLGALDSAPPDAVSFLPITSEPHLASALLQPRGDRGDGGMCGR